LNAAAYRWKGVDLALGFINRYDSAPSQWQDPPYITVLGSANEEDVRAAILSLAPKKAVKKRASKKPVASKKATKKKK
jgi:hypothetical protein